jgi:hypothetical protein
MMPQNLIAVLPDDTASHSCEKVKPKEMWIRSADSNKHKEFLALYSNTSLTCEDYALHT